MDEETQYATTIEALRVMAHPTRIHVYDLLIREGPLTVSTLAIKAGIAVGSASYHLQQMNNVGLVEEARNADTDRRRHWWRAIPGGLRWSPADFLDSPSGRKISSLGQQALSKRRIRRLAHWQETWQDWPKEWIDAAVETDALLELSPEELTELGQEIQKLIRSYSAKVKADENTRYPVFFFLHGFPTDESD